MQYDSSFPFTHSNVICGESVHGRSLVPQRAQPKIIRGYPIMFVVNIHFLRAIWNKASLCLNKLTRTSLSLLKSGSSNRPECPIVACIESGKETLARSNIERSASGTAILLIRGTKEEGEIILDRGLLTSSLGVKTPPLQFQISPSNAA